MLLQPEHGVPGAAEQGQIRLQQRIVKGFQSFDIGAAGQQHPGVGNQPPPQHYGVHLGKLPG